MVIPNYVKSREEQMIDDLTEVVAVLLASNHDRIYSTHARDVAPVVRRIADRVEEDGNVALSSSLKNSAGRLEAMAPPR